MYVLCVYSQDLTMSQISVAYNIIATAIIVSNYYIEDGIKNLRF